MAYVVDRVVICDAFREPDRHYQLLPGGKSRLKEGRRSSVRFLASARDVQGGIAAVVGREATLFEDMLIAGEQMNDFINHLRDEVRVWRDAGYPGTAVVTRRLLAWWFERDEEDPAGEHNLYDGFEMVPPEYREEFHPNVLVRNWQGIPLENKREDWIGEGEVPLEEGRFIPQAVLRAMQRRARQDPNAPIRRLLGGWRDLVVINDEAHHVYGEKRGRKGDEPEHIKWSKILQRIGKAARVSLVIDLSATPWYGSGSPKPEGTLFEWLVCDFSVYDAFESGLVKVVRLPDPDEHGRVYLDLWDLVKGAKTKEEYLRACKGAIASIYSSWRKDFQEWLELFDFAKT